MKIGKLPNDILHEIVINNIKNKREEVLVGAGLGEDNAIVDFGDKLCILSTDPITGATKDLGKLAVHISCNDVAASGAEPVALLFTILAPESSSLEDIEKIMKDAGRTSKELDIQIAGGHTEITDAVNRFVVTTTVIGIQDKDKMLDKDAIRPGHKILMTKSAAIEGSSILAKEREDFLLDFLTREEIKRAQDMDKDLSVVKEGRLAGKLGVNYMHDITEGGVLGAVWEASYAIGQGVFIDESLVPIDPLSQKICQAFQIEPLSLISSGSMIIICSEACLKDLTQALTKEGIGLSLIGEVRESGRTIKRLDGSLEEIEAPETDELYRALKL